LLALIWHPLVSPIFYFLYGLKNILYLNKHTNVSFLGLPTLIRLFFFFPKNKKE